MKKIMLFVFLLMINTMAATCELTWPIDIFFKDSTIWRDKYAFASGSVYVTEDGYNCEKKEFEKAFLDSNIYLSRYSSVKGLPGWKRINITQNEKSEHKIGDVFRDEFLHWQKCGMLKMSYEEADSLIAPLVSVLNHWDENEPYGRFSMSQVEASNVGVPYCHPDEIVKWANEDCKAEAPPQSNKSIAINNAKLVVENSVVHVPQTLQGKKYFIFDMNGRILQKGFAEKMIRIEHNPSILKLGSDTPLFLK